MPRTFDFDNKDRDANRQAYENGETYPNLASMVSGKNEVDLRAIHGPHGLFLFGAETHQFRLKHSEDIPATNANFDEVFTWIDEHTSGRWHWFEASTNHGHSTSVRIWMEDEEDTRSLVTQFPDRLFFDEAAHQSNLEVRQKVRESTTGLHPALTPNLLCHMIEWGDEESISYIETIRTQPGFPSMFALSMAKLRERAELPEETLLERLASIISDEPDIDAQARLVRYLDQLGTPFVAAVLSRCGFHDNGTNVAI